MNNASTQLLPEFSGVIFCYFAVSLLQGPCFELIYYWYQQKESVNLATT